MVHELSTFLTREMQVLQLRYLHALTNISKCQAKTFCTNLTQLNAEGGLIRFSEPIQNNLNNPETRNKEIKIEENLPSK